MCVVEVRDEGLCGVNFNNLFELITEGFYSF